ncbi:FixH family protein [Brevibacterium sp. JNUCC-42]|nr:FixH family protein [Brevibacterium sp. JNUCC-42]
MNKLFISIVMVPALLLASACTASTDQSSTQNTTPKLVEVDILIPEEISLNEESVLKVQLTQGKENVEDAEDIQFEIWNSNRKEASELIKAQHEKGGIYSVKKTFKENGIYYVQTHVMARGLHVMPKKQFVVGNVSEEELNSIKEESQNQEQSHGHGHHH